MVPALHGKGLDGHCAAQPSVLSPVNRGFAPGTVRAAVRVRERSAPAAEGLDDSVVGGPGARLNAHDPPAPLQDRPGSGKGAALCRPPAHDAATRMGAASTTESILLCAVGPWTLPRSIVCPTELKVVTPSRAAGLRLPCSPRFRHAPTPSFLSTFLGPVLPPPSSLLATFRTPRSRTPSASPALSSAARRFSLTFGFSSPKLALPGGGRWA